jgi:5-methyltetrahydrofolate--homocysteine methyltransferase
MDSILDKIACCVERGKADSQSPHPSDMKGQEGAAELTRQALKEGISARDILAKALIVGMQRVGEKFSNSEAFIPDLLISADAMNAAMKFIEPYFESGEAQHKGTFVIGTVAGDLHDIGKNIVRMVLKGNGWKVVDLGINVSSPKFLETIEQHPGCVVGMSSLLTTTMLSMEKIVRAIKDKYPGTTVIVGGAPVSTAFSEKIGADAYFPDPHRLVAYLDQTYHFQD